MGPANFVGGAAIMGHFDDLPLKAGGTGVIEKAEGDCFVVAGGIEPRGSALARGCGQPAEDAGSVLVEAIGAGWKRVVHAAWLARMTAIGTF